MKDENDTYSEKKVECTLNQIQNNKKAQIFE